MVEVVEDGGVNGGEFLQTSHPPKPQHRPLSSSKWLMGILCSVVSPPACLLPIADAELPEGSPVGRQPIGHDLYDAAMSFQRFPDEFQRCFHVAGLCHEAFEHFTFVIDGAPEVVSFAVDLHEHLVQVPAPLARA